MKHKKKRVYQDKIWQAARLYRKEGDKSFKARAYFAAIVMRGCELEAVLRIFDFVETRRPEDRCTKLYWLINRAFARHWIPHDGLRYWKTTGYPALKACLHDIREARNGVHAHLFQHDLATRRAVVNITRVVDSMYELLEIKNARNLMKHLHEGGDIDLAPENWTT